MSGTEDCLRGGISRTNVRLTESSHDLREIDEELAEEVRALLAELDSAGRA